MRVLFIGESPPAGGTFFYSADSQLFRSTRDAFCAALGTSEDGEAFLERFAGLGCYLEDLCQHPVNRLTPGERRAANRGAEQRLTRTLRALRPQVIVVLLKSIEANVIRAAAAAGCADTEMHVLTYPSRWHRHRAAYREGLTALLRDFRGRRIFAR